MEEQEMKELAERADVFMQTGDVKQALALPTDKIDDKALKQTFEDEQLPDAKETKKIKKKVRKIWGNYRNNALEEIDLENYKKFCELQKIKAESESELQKIKFKKEKERAEHWLEMHKGNLEEIGYNTTSMPNKYFYAKDRYIHYMNNTMKRIPKWTWYILCGVAGVALIVLMALGISKLF